MKTYAVQLEDSYKPKNIPGYNSSGETGVAQTNIVLHTIQGSLLYFAIPVTILAIIVAGLKMVVYGDESEEIDKAKDTLKWSVIGLFVIILSYSIIKIVITISLKAANK